jgi:hypothetical protein
MAKTDNGPLELIIKAAASLPLVRIDRDKFLDKHLIKYCTRKQVDYAIANNPAHAGIGKETINMIAKSCISYESKKVTAISALSGIPGGLAMIGTIPADTSQYFAHVLRILQKLVYLYGWESLFDDSGDMDDETMSLLSLFFGIMFGVEGAAKMISQLSASAALRASKSIAAKPLMKGVIYPIIKEIAKVFGKSMTKGAFAKSVSKAIPVIGAVVSGGLTYVSFRPMAHKLQEYLAGLKWADPEYYRTVVDISNNQDA